MRRIALIALLLLSACTEEAKPPATPPPTGADISLSGPVAIDVWHALTGPSQQALTDLVTKFNTTNAEKITVTPRYQGSYSQLQQKSLAATQSGTLPELLIGFESFAADLARAGVVLPLDPYLASKKNGLDKPSQDDLYKAFLDGERYGQYGNQLLSFPFQRALFATYQNDSALKEINRTTPRTWAEFEDVARAATKRGTAGTARFGWAVTVSASTFNGWVVSRGGKLISDDGKTVAWDGKEGADALRLFQKLIGEGVAYVPKGFDYQSDFAVGKVAFVQESSAFRPFIASAVKGTTVQWSIQSIPQIDSSKARTITYGPSLIVMKSTADKQLAAWLFARWLTEKDQTAEWAAATASLPLRKSAAGADPLKKAWSADEQGKQAFDQVGTATAEPNVRGQQDVRTVIEDLLVAVASRSVPDIDKALKDAAARANAILKENQ